MITEDEFIGGAVASYIGLNDAEYTAQFRHDRIGGVPFLEIVGAGETYRPITSERDARTFFMNLPLTARSS